MLVHMFLSSLVIFAFCWLAQILWDAVTAPVYRFMDSRQKI